jgi:hypothetical protein
MTRETLEEYLADDYRRDLGDIRDLEEMLDCTANVFLYAQADDGRWPYSFNQNSGSEGGKEPSQGTQAMIAAALARLSDQGLLASGRPAQLGPLCNTEVQVSLHAGVQCLASAIKGELRSRSFGIDDPVTLSHLLDFLRSTKRSKHADWDKLLKACAGAVTELLEIAKLDLRAETLLRHLPKVHSVFEGEKPNTVPGFEPDYLTNAFVPLRVVRSLADLAAIDDGFVKPDLKRFRRFFESTLHEQLSYSDIPDSRFDPAELIFCLEGLLLVAPNAVDDRLFNRAMNVLEAKQEESAHWRPNRPIYATKQGMTMLPVSVEGAVSFMRSVAVMDRQSSYKPLSSRAVPMARRFWQWLRARAVHFEAASKPVVAEKNDQRSAAGVSGDPLGRKYEQLTGWHSEHVNNPELIHLWDTSQVVEFMLAYRELLQRSVAGRTLSLSGIKINRPARDLPTTWKAKWDKTIEDFEPRPASPPEDQVYRRIESAFIKPWAENKAEKSYSMLLYGPPGTGKSTLAENIADALGMAMVTVTVSDFLGRGGANVEARAKAIFQTLEAQFNTVILFDEIDSFLLDRDTERYSKQDTLFQFLTPGMLTKINDLRKLKRSIFIIATNYENRIDPAIKRKGRIDRHYLLQLPDKERRRAILAEQMGIKREAVSDELVEATVFFGYSDMKSAVQEAGGRGANSDSVKREVIDPERAPATYQSYLNRIGEENFPHTELFGLVQLRQEVQPSYDVNALFTEAGLNGDDPKAGPLRSEWERFTKVDDADQKDG